MSTHHINVGDTTLYCELTGPQDAQIVCFSHCFGSNHHYWDSHLKAANGYRLLRYDARGHGLSGCPPGPYSLDQMARDVVAILDALAIDQVHFVGVSMGGMVGQILALNFAQRLRSVTLANSPCHYSDAQIKLWHERAQHVLDHGIDSVKPALMQRWFTDEAASNKSPGYLFINDAFSQFTADSFAAATAAVSQINTRDRLHQIAMPTLLFGSLDDPGVPVDVSRFMAEQIPDAELHWLTPSRHLASLEQTEPFNQALRHFLQRVS